MPDSKKEKSFIVRVKAGDLLDLLGKSKEENKIKVRLAQLYSDYDPGEYIVIQITDKTGKE